MSEQEPTPAEHAMEDICDNLERFFNGQQPQERAFAAVCQISGRYRMETCK